jgi:TonB-dependent Receptor Plug Domain
MSTSRPRLSSALLGAALAAALLAAPSFAQEPDAPAPPAQPQVSVHVTDGSTGGPIAGADVRLGERRVVTGADGIARMVRPAGAQNVVVTRMGYQTRSVPVGTETRLAVPLTIIPVSVAGVEASSRPQAHSPLLRRFYDRLERGRGAFVTREQIEQRRPRRLVDAFREIPGVRVTATPRGERLMMSGALPFMYQSAGAAKGDCPVQYYLDGSMWEPDAPGVISNDVRPEEVEGIEVYRRLSEVPAEFRRPGSECGVVLIWLKESVT